MADPYLGFATIAESSNDPFTLANGMTGRISSATQASLGVDITVGGTFVVSTSDYQTYFALRLFGTPPGAVTVVVPSQDRYIAFLNTTAQTVTLDTSGGAATTLPLYPNQRVVVQAVNNDLFVKATNATIFTAFNPNLPIASQEMLRLLAPFDFTVPAGLVGSATSQTVNATSDTIFDVNKNGSPFGTITFQSAGTSVLAAASATNFVKATDVLTIVAPATPDATLAGPSISLFSTRD